MCITCPQTTIYGAILFILFANMSNVFVFTCQNVNLSQNGLIQNKSILSFYTSFAPPNRLRFFPPQGLQTHTLHSNLCILDLIKSLSPWFSISSLFMPYRILSFVVSY